MLELMFPSPRQYFLIIFLVFLTACTNETTALPVETPIQTVASPTPVPTSTLITITDIPTLVPPQPTMPIITPDAVQVERWKEYEKALAKAFFSYLPPEEVLCEWDFLGRSVQEVYLWGVCMSINPIGTTAGGRDIFYSSSTPAVLHLRGDGSVQGVEIPGAGSQYAPDIRRMFPPDIQEKFDRYPSGRATEMSEHIEWRRKYPEEPPLIVFSATPMP